MRGVITIAQLCQECLRYADRARTHCSAVHASYTNVHALYKNAHALYTNVHVLYTNPRASPDQSVERSHINCSSG